MKFHDENSVDQGIMLEEIYRNKLMEKLRGDHSKELADRIIGVGESELGGLEKRPVYQELEKIPMNDQLNMMRDHFNSIKEERYDPDLDKRLDDIMKLKLAEGQRVG